MVEKDLIIALVARFGLNAHGRRWKPIKCWKPLAIYLTQLTENNGKGTNTMPKEIKLSIAFIAYLIAAMALETILFS